MRSIAMIIVLFFSKNTFEAQRPFQQPQKLQAIAGIIPIFRILDTYKLECFQRGCSFAIDIRTQAVF